MFSLCIEQCVNQVICGCIMFIPSIWMCAVEYVRKNLQRLTVNSFIQLLRLRSHEKMRCLLEHCMS